MEQQNKNKLKIAIIIVAILLALSLLTLVGVLLYRHFAAPGPATVVVPDNIITQDPDPNATAPATEDTDSTAPTHKATEPTKPKKEELATAIYIHNRNPGDNEPFYVDNMFPGDVEKQNFCIHVTYKDAVALRFRADIHPGYEKLAEVLKCKVVVLTTGQTLYDGLMKDMPASLDILLPAYEDGITLARYYEVTAYLDTSVGNEYQNKELKADFVWWVEEAANLLPPTGDNTNLVLPGVLCGVSCVVLILLLTAKKKEGRYAR